MIPIKKVLGGVAALALLAACEHGDPVSTAATAEGAALLLSANASGTSLPSGSATVTSSFGGFDPSITDAFGRKPSNATVARRTRYYAASQSAAAYWEWPWDNLRSARSETIDPRPSLINGVAKVPSSTTVDLHGSYPYIDLYQPNSPYPADEYWEMFTRWTGLTPSTQHQMVFVQYRLRVAGDLDQGELMLTGAITQPDTLVLAPGTLGSINTDWSGDAPGGCAAFPGAGTNPFVVATFTSVADPTLRNTLDKCFTSGNGIWTAAEFDVQAKSMVGRTDDQGFALPNYNYIELWEGQFGTGTLVGRLQIAQDLTSSGKPMPNGYSPFPAPNTTEYWADGGQTAPPAADQEPEFPLPASLLQTLPGAAGVPTQVVATLSNVQALASPAAYKFWYINRTTGQAAPATGRILRIVGTDTAEDVSSTSTFTGGPGTIKFIGDDYLTTIGATDYIDSLRFLVVTQESSAGATTPSRSQPFWVGIFKAGGGTAGGAMTFGTFNADSAASRSPIRFVAQGTVRGGVIGRRQGDEFIGSIIEFTFRNLQRPPKGYQYVGFLRETADTTELLEIGDLSDTRGNSLVDADVAATGGDLSETQILVGRLRYDVHSVADDEICNYDAFRLYLMPKDGTVDPSPPVLIFNVPLPDPITQATSCR